MLGEGTLARQCFMNLIWLIGTYLFAAVLGCALLDLVWWFSRDAAGCECPFAPIWWQLCLGAPLQLKDLW